MLFKKKNSIEIDSVQMTADVWTGWNIAAFAGTAEGGDILLERGKAEPP